MLDALSNPQTWLAFVTLALLEIVLGVDNVIFITLLVAKVPAPHQRAARTWGLLLAMLTRIALLCSVVWLTGLTRPLLRLAAQALSARDLILLAGGLFLLAKSVIEIHHALEGAAAGRPRARARAGVLVTVVQIGVMDIVFSLDSVFVAVGLTGELYIMVAAIVVAILVMMGVSGTVGAFVERHPTIKMLALAFLILIGASLVAEALHYEMPKRYLYFAMGFAVAVELINLRVRALSDRR